jgi:F-type H+-transporting ATPase subunit gamma
MAGGQERILKERIRSIRATKKITRAMELIAASRIVKAQQRVAAARPYSERITEVIRNLAAAGAGGDSPLLNPRTEVTTVAYVVVAADRGLAGGYNASILREARRRIRDQLGQGKTVKLMTIGRKGRDSLRRDYSKLIGESLTEVGRRQLGYADAREIAQKVLAMYERGEFDVATIVYNRFKSAMTQIVTPQQLVPFAPPAAAEAEGEIGGGVYEFEPEEDEILAQLLPNNLAVQVYAALLESAASEQGARMTAMDSATRNAGDMISRLTITYNRTRQAVITKELIEIVSGAEAL